MKRFEMHLRLACAMVALACPGLSGAHQEDAVPAAPKLSRSAAVPAAASLPATGSGTGKHQLKPYVREDYLLAFDTFVGVGDLPNALAVARHAADSEPADIEWRIKLARVAEWTGQFELAWQQRARLYRAGRHDTETVDAMLRLGVVAFEPELLLDAWLAAARTRKLAATQWGEIHQLFDRVGRPAEGAAFFETQYRRQGGSQLLEWAAEHAEHAGLDELALRLYRERAASEPFSAQAILAAATYLIRRDRMNEAHALLEEHSERVSPDNRDYWLALGGVAWELVELESAERAYRLYLASAPGDGGLWSRLIYLVQRKNPRAAAELALTAYRRNGGTANLMLALSQFAATRAEREFAAALAELSPETLATLESDPGFLLLRGTHLQRRMDYSAAWHDLERAAMLAPGNDDIAGAVLWFLIDRRELDRLDVYLQHWRARAATSPSFWLAYAAGHHALDRYREAVEWYRREVGRHPEDALLLLNYADAVERLQQVGMAQRIRRHAWELLRNDRSAGVPTELPTSAQALAALRLTILDRPGDAAARLAMRIAGLLRGLPAELSGLPDDIVGQTRDVVLGWAISAEQFPNARHWMIAQYLRSPGRSAPVWGESQTALRLDDTQSLQRLLSRETSALPIYNRYDAAYALEDWQHALDIAFAGMENNPVDAELHDRFRLHAPLHAHYLQYRLRNDRLGDYRGLTQELEAFWQLTPRLALLVQTMHLSQHSDESQIDFFTPRRDTLHGIEGRWRGQQGNSRFALFRRNELNRVFGWRISQEWRWGRRLTLDGAWESGGEATDSLPLRVGGYRNGWRIGANYALSKRDNLHLVIRSDDHHTQFGDRLGTGRVIDLDFTHRLRIEYPDWRVRVFATQARYQPEGEVGSQALAYLAPEVRAQIAAGALDAVRYFLPADSTTLGTCIGMGENLAGQALRETYSRAWRHYYELCATDNNVVGRGYSADFGMAGSFDGEDHVQFALGQSAGGTGNQGINRYLQFRYRRYF